MVESNLLDLWEKGIKTWCEGRGVGGVFEQAGPVGDYSYKWIQFCKLIGGHSVRFWNDGDEDPPKRIGVRVFQKGGGELDMGDLEEFKGDFLRTRKEDHESNALSTREIRGVLSPIGSTLLPKSEELCYRAFVGVHGEDKFLSIRPPLSGSDYARVNELKGKLKTCMVEREPLYKVREKAFEESLEAIGTPKREELRKKFEDVDVPYKAKNKECRDYDEEIRIIREKYPQISKASEKEFWDMIRESENGGEGDVQVDTGGGISGYIWDSSFLLPCGLKPEAKTMVEEAREREIIVEPAPYSRLLEFNEDTWFNEIRTNPMYEFRQPSTTAVATVKELFDVGYESVKVKTSTGVINLEPRHL